MDPGVGANWGGLAPDPLPPDPTHWSLCPVMVDKMMLHPRPDGAQAGHSLVSSMGRMLATLLSQGTMTLEGWTPSLVPDPGWNLVTRL